MTELERPLTTRPFKIVTATYSGLPDVEPFDDTTALWRAANRRAWDDSVERLSAGLIGIDWQDEANRTSGGSPRPVDVSGDLFRSLDAAAVVDRLLSESEHSSRVGFSTEELQFAAGAYTSPDVYVPTDPPTRLMDLGRVASAMDDGHGLVRNAADLDCREWWPLLEDIERALGALVQVNLYLTNGSHPGFGPHWDDHEVLVIQVEGSKIWQFHAPVDLSPVRPLTGPDVGDLAGDPIRIEAGQAIWVPRGWGHTVLPLDCPSTHLTFGIHRPMWTDIAQTVAQLLKRHPRARGYVPMDLRQPVLSYDGTGVGTAEGFVAEFDELFRNVSVDRMVAATHANRRGRPASSLRSTIHAMLGDAWDEVEVRSAFVGGVWPFEATEEGTTAVVGGARCYVFSSVIAPAMARLADSRPATAAQLAEFLDGDLTAAAEVVEAAVRSGFAQVVG